MKVTGKAAHVPENPCYCLKLSSAPVGFPKIPTMVFSVNKVERRSFCVHVANTGQWDLGSFRSSSFTVLRTADGNGTTVSSNII